MLERINAAHPWSHNEAFSGFVLRHARAVRRRGGTSSLDVGCGTGRLVRRLAAVFPNVTGLEPHARTAAIAAERTRDLPGVRIEERAFGPNEAKHDLIVFVASLHHMPLADSLTAARGALNPGGRIVIVGLAKETAADAGRSLASALLNPIVGTVRHPRRARTAPPQMSAPVAAPQLTVEEITRTAQQVLPGIRLRRRLFWRYTAVWTSPAITQ